jgi:SAM-dependent methyltransferase
MNYADFVAFIGQPNSPPGGKVAVRTWIKTARIDSDSRVLDLACSTGFSSRFVVQATGCRAVGIDLSMEAIREAKRAARKVDVQGRIHYQVGDATLLEFADQSFSHILAGCTFSFIQGRDRALDESARVLVVHGVLCTALFFYCRPPPPELLDQIEETIGFRPSPDWDYSFWSTFFSRRFCLAAEQTYTLQFMSASQIKAAVHDFVFGESEPLAEQPLEVKQACYRRLLSIRELLNEHRRYQKIAIAVWRLT